MTPAQTLLSILTDINFDLHELKGLLGQSDNVLVQYLKPLTLGADDDDGNRNIELTSHDFAPQPMPWPECLDAAFGYNVMPDRVPNSLPRYLGHIVVPNQYKDLLWRLVLKINAAKELFHKGSKALYRDQGVANKITYSQFLRENEVFNNGEHYEMVIRPIITSRHAFIKGNKLPGEESVDFNSLTDDDDFQLRNLSIKWLISNYTQVEKGKFSELQELKELETKADVAAAMQKYEAKNPNTIFVKRFYLPPAPIAHYCFSDKWLSNKFTVNSPILVFDEIMDAEYKTQLEPIDVALVSGTARSVKSLKALDDKICEIVQGSNWYALL